MKIGFYNPYFDSLSGGERYILTIASHWSKKYDVVLFWDDPDITTRAEHRLHIDLSRVRTVENVFKTRNVFKKMIVSRGYDLLFFLTDGSIPTTFAKYNILHFQVPFQHIQMHPIKLARFQKIVVNSEFTKRNIDPRVGKHARVIYPPVTAITGKTSKKKIILSVGRFHPLKKQDVLIEAFRDGKFSGYELVLTGGLMPADREYYKRLQFASKKLQVRLLPNISFDDISRLYKQASVYWHAAGYHEVKPEHMEHFGISTVEAMSAGCIPVVFAGGGLPEIIKEGENGFLWANVEDLTRRTLNIISSKTLRSRLSKNAVAQAKLFATEKFNQSFDELLASITR